MSIARCSSPSSSDSVVGRCVDAALQAYVSTRALTGCGVLIKFSLVSKRDARSS